jgi:hypothetical protein
VHVVYGLITVEEEVGGGIRDRKERVEVQRGERREGDTELDLHTVLHI